MYKPKINRLFLLLGLLIATSCGSSDKPDVIKTKSGLYGSAAGQFLIKFPSKPTTGINKNIVGGKEMNLYSLSYSQGGEHRYRVSYIDYPPEVLKSWDIEELFDQMVKTGLSAIESFEVRERTVESSSFEKSIVYNIRSSEFPTANCIMRLIQSEGRTYLILFYAAYNVPNSAEFDEFVKSFKIYKPKP